MALILDPTLADAQDAQVREPIIDLVSGSYAADLPLEGTPLTGDAGESAPASIILSTGVMITAMAYGVSPTSHIRYGYTDASRTAFTYVDINDPDDHTVLDVSVCGLANGNVGLLYRTILGTTEYIKRMIVTSAGVFVSGSTVVTYTGSPWLSGPHAIRMASGSYLAVFIRLVGSDYRFHKMTSADFVTWVGPEEITVDGLTLTSRKFDPFLIRITTGDIWLLFSYTEAIDGSGAELSNIYYTVSSDNGLNWSSIISANKITHYTLFSQVATHPTAIQKTTGTMRLLFNEVMTALNIDENTAGLDGAIVTPSDMTFDPVTRKLYVVSSRQWYGAKSFYCVFRVDVDTRTVEKKWDLLSTPAFPSVFDNVHDVYWDRHHGEQYLIPIGIVNSAGFTCVSLLNASTDEGAITNYVFDNLPSYSLTKNVTHSLMANYYLGHTWVDFSNNRLYCLFCSGMYVIVGYIEVTEIGPNYTFHTLIDDSSAYEAGTQAVDPGFLVLPTEDLIIVSNHCAVSSWAGVVQIYQLSTGAAYKRYTKALYAGFPLHGIGLCRLAWIGGHIYGTFTYESLYGEADKRGLCDIDTNIDAVTCHRPSQATLDEYYLTSCEATADGRLIISTYGYGIAIFDPTIESWEIYNSDNVPGIFGGGDSDIFGALEYDDDQGFIFAGRLVGGGDEGLTMFSEYGYMRQAQYSEGLLGTEWTFGTPAALVSGYTDFDAVGAVDPSDSAMYGFWVYDDGTNTEVMWGKEGATVSLNPYLLRGSDVVFKSSVDGTPSQLDFSVSHGHLFDPHNLNSLFSIYLKKGRKIILRWGDKVAGQDYFQNQGSFLVTETKLSYGLEEYPVMQVIAKDRRCTWDHAQILATDAYETYPENILSDVASEFLGFIPAGSPGADIDIPTFDTREIIYIQWVEAMAQDIITQVCNRFGYYPRMTVNDKFSARRINDPNAVVHVYPDTTRIIDFTPDDSFSDFTNRVIVTGFERSEIEVLYGEERIETLLGTIGWWRRKKDYKIYYSKDMSRRCRDPRIVILESVTSAPMQLGGRASESISYIDPDGYYCVITVEGPDLAPMIISALAIIVASYFIGDAVISLGGGWTKPVGTLIQMIGINLVIGILGSICNFQYEVWARPLGLVKRSIQGQADDTELQTLVRAIVPRKLDDSLCNTVNACNWVAAYELMVAILQRSRVNFSKTAHLQDEDGDPLQVPHPYTSRPLKIFVTDLTRRMRVPVSSNDEGYFKDEFEGWRLPA